MRTAKIAILAAAIVGAMPADATRYLAVDIHTSGKVYFARPDFYEDVYSLNTHVNVLLNLDDIAPGESFFPTVPGWGYLSTSYSAAGFSVFGDRSGVDFFASFSLVGLDFSKPFNKIFKGVGSFTSYYTYSRYDLLEEVHGTIPYAAVRRFNSDDVIASSISIEQSWTSAPEPVSWGMMLGGFGLIGVAMRYRRRWATFA